MVYVSWISRLLSVWSGIHEFVNCKIHFNYNEYLALDIHID